MKLLQILNEIEVRNIMSYTIIVGDKTIVVAPEDLDEEMDWYNAREACKKLGDGKWRLPTLGELEEMCKQLHEQGKGNFENTRYWSSSHIDLFNAWMVNFNINSTASSVGYGFIKKWNGQVRPVRDI